MNDSSVDGRVLRGRRTRERIIESLLELLDEGQAEPAATAIAERAGVSVRTIYQHFDDIETLYAGLVEAQAARVAPLLEPPDPSGDLDERIDALVEQRRVLHETTAPVRRAINVRVERSPAVQQRLADLAAILREQLGEHFVGEFDDIDDPLLIDAVDALCSFECWERLRRQQRLDADSAAAVLRCGLRRLLS